MGNLYLYHQIYARTALLGYNTQVSYFFLNKIVTKIFINNVHNKNLIITSVHKGFIKILKSIVIAQRF